VKYHEVNPPRLHHPRLRGSNQIQMVVPHPIQQNKVEKKNVGGVMGFIIRTIIPIYHKPQLPTLIPTNHVPIIVMGTKNYKNRNYVATLILGSRPR
jgi:hypothetical protein